MGIITQISKMAPLIVPVTMNSIISGEDVTNAMDLRCFGIKPRTWLEKTDFCRRDVYLMIFTGVMLVGFHNIEYSISILASSGCPPG